MLWKHSIVTKGYGRVRIGSNKQLRLYIPQETNIKIIWNLTQIRAFWTIFQKSWERQSAWSGRWDKRNPWIYWRREDEAIERKKGVRIYIGENICHGWSSHIICSIVRDISCKDNIMNILKIHHQIITRIIFISITEESYRSYRLEFFLLISDIWQ